MCRVRPASFVLAFCLCQRPFLCYSEWRWKRWRLWGWLVIYEFYSVFLGGFNKIVRKNWVTFRTCISFTWFWCAETSSTFYWRNLFFVSAYMLHYTVNTWLLLWFLNERSKKLIFKAFAVRTVKLYLKQVESSTCCEIWSHL